MKDSLEHYECITHNGLNARIKSVNSQNLLAAYIQREIVIWRSMGKMNKLVWSRRALCFDVHPAHDDTSSAMTDNFDGAKFGGQDQFPAAAAVRFMENW